MGGGFDSYFHEVQEIAHLRVFVFFGLLVLREELPQELH